MRRRRAGAPVREALSARYREFARRPWDKGGRFARLADRLEAGEPVTVHGYEVGMPDVARVRVAADGSLTPVQDTGTDGGRQ